MDKKALQTYATWSKQYLEQQIELSLKSLGIHGDEDIRDAKRVGDITVIDGDSKSYPAELKEQRESIIKLIRTSGYENTVETFAYTWFNRIIALRFMEVHDFLPHGFRVLSDRTGGFEPEILKNLSLIKDELRLDISVVSEFNEKNDLEGLFRYVLFKQCNSLSNTLPMLFDKEEAFMELLLPKTLLKGDTVITKLREIPEETFLDDIEVIGWLYQYYISAKKDKVYADLKKNIKISSDNIPAATQLFTPDWIVRYMVENSLGRIWMESYPNSSLKPLMKYYLDEVSQDDVVEQELQSKRYKNVNLEEITILEPCCGSGHILVYLFDLLYQMYIERGFLPREIPTIILSKNLFGLEIDKRASQLASFALVMRARSINNRFFEDKYYVRPNVFEIYDSKELDAMNYRSQLNETSLTSDEKLEIIKIVDLFDDAKNVGSLINPNRIKIELLDEIVTKLKSEVITTFNVVFLNDGLKALSRLISQAKIMSRKYDVCVTNPPYMGGSGMNGNVSEYVKEHFPNTKMDLFSCFIEKGFHFLKPNGFNCMVTMQSWMFLTTFEHMRKDLLENKTIYCLMHMDNMVMGIAFGTAVTVFRNNRIPHYKGTFNHIKTKDASYNSPESFPVVGNRFAQIGADSFLSIPSYPIAYWISEQMINLLGNPTRLEDVSYPRKGLTTGDNERFVRLWYEICSNRFSVFSNSPKWFPMTKGGDYRRWYGNNDYVLNWENDGYELTNYKGAVIRSPKFYFHECISWNDTSSGGRIAFRYQDDNTFIPNASGPCVYFGNTSKWYILGFVNSKVSNTLLKAIAPTMKFEVGQISSLPYVFSENECQQIELLVQDSILESRNDWNSFETSWEFLEHPLVRWSHELWDITAIGANMQYYYGCYPEVKGPLELCYMLWQGECNDRFQKLKRNEEDLNRFFISIYGLQDELTPEVENEDITIRRADLQRDVKSFISYLVGVVMGRYSLDVPGLIYAGGEWDSSKYRSYQPDDDGIVPIYVGVGMEDGLTARIAELVKLIYGEESFKENIDFIAEALGKANNESSLETLNRYLNDGFYADHIKIYQKRPIYWLFSSGKQKGFKCLVYMHRYNKDTLARVNAKYYLPESTRQKISLEEIEEQLKTTDGKEKIRLEKNRQKLFDKFNETIEYGQVLDHMANKYIDINLDDGVNVNYAKFQGIELVSDSGVKIKKDLLVPLK